MVNEIIKNLGNDIGVYIFANNQNNARPSSEIFGEYRISHIEYAHPKEWSRSYNEIENDMVEVITEANALLGIQCNFISSSNDADIIDEMLHEISRAWMWLMFDGYDVITDNYCRLIHIDTEIQCDYDEDSHEDQIKAGFTFYIEKALAYMHTIEKNNDMQYIQTPIIGGIKNESEIH